MIRENAESGQSSYSHDILLYTLCYLLLITFIDTQPHRRAPCHQTA
jgi:hypothetical protein